MPVIGYLVCPKCGSKCNFVLGYYEIGCCYCGADMYLACPKCGEVIMTFAKCREDIHDIQEITEPIKKG